MSAVPTVVRSRWGFHPCEFATYRKLKFLNAVYLRAVRMARAWQRWSRKAPHNRVRRRRLRNETGQTIGYGPPVPLVEPSLCGVFSRKCQEKRFVDKRGTCFHEGFWEDTVVTEEPWVARDYAAARAPAPRPEDVRPLHHTIDEINALFEKARAWAEGQDRG
ncbi:MAG TPA: hypothetical protein VJ739_14645 [Gemmataceae bacterium]|nr:hypothetical protein [Gemmataceae bacterium]